MSTLAQSGRVARIVRALSLHGIEIANLMMFSKSDWTNLEVTLQLSELDVSVLQHYIAAIRRRYGLPDAEGSCRIVSCQATRL